MGAIVVVLLLALLLAAAVMIYVAYPYRGEETPVHPAVGEVMRRGVLSLPTIGAQTAAQKTTQKTARKTARKTTQKTARKVAQRSVRTPEKVGAHR